MTRPAHLTGAAAASLLVGTLLSSACMDLNVPDLNNPAIGDLQANPTRGGVVTATQGLLIGARANIAPFNGYIAELGVLGRESYGWNAGDPRFITELLRGPLDGGSPRFGGNLWYDRLANIRNAGIVLKALAVLGPTPPVGMTTTEQAATSGFVKTIEALDFLLLIDTRDTLGAPVDVNQDVGAPLAPFVKRDSVFGFIVGLLDSADVALAAGGTSFPFGLPAGFSGFATPAKFIQFNRALKARVEAYRATLLACGAPCWTRSRSALDSSFLSVVADTALRDAVDSVAPAAAALINYIRVNSGRLPPRAGLGALPTDTIINEILKQRVYSLLFEGGHRWIDARRYGRLYPSVVSPGLPNPVAGDSVFTVMPIPTDECSARGLPANCHPLTP